jgi:thiol-disulfide isomerase/thioredoxin
MNNSDRSRQRKSKWRYVREFAFFAALLILIYMFQTRHLLEADGTPAPALHGQLLGGGEIDLNQINAERTLVYFLAPWCAYCKASMSNIERVKRWRDDESLAVILVALGWESEAEMAEFVQAHDVGSPVILADQRTAQAWNVYAFPTYYILSERHEVVRRDMGYSTTLGLYLRTM